SLSMLGGALAMVAMCVDTTTRSLGADDVVAKSMETLQRDAMRISAIMRPCSLTTYRVLSTAADVPVFASAPGQWIEPTDGEARPPIQFRAASGTESLSAAQLTEVRGLRLQLDPREIANGRDDDGDGLIDEGDVVLDYAGMQVHIASNIEGLTFTLTSR